MNHLLLDGLIVVVGAPLLALLGCVLSSCMLSSQISREEEARELAETMRKLKDAA